MKGLTAIEIKMTIICVQEIKKYQSCIENPAKIVNVFRKTLHLRWLEGFWIRLCYGKYLFENLQVPVKRKFYEESSI